ncbi:MAG: SHOCT domain-containing protein [Gammaproteobacteria bacterium]|nr:SHOCT domain-containing protein [Gammaproteobacteria bacterium]MDH3373406.1 SHOCT domain-containing protein [Gammaproteobacteria bacterium]MDH3408207.1 SHOCT domain-containing protein [Gammaproteobacteria bacterium]MDH3553302.1 SHOCT domain-containing protein [Gammaproteobacteria bacterium]
MNSSLALMLICAAGATQAIAQTSDKEARTDRSPTYDEQQVRALEVERQRLGNERIQRDMELRAREEERRLEEAQKEAVRAQDDIGERKAASASKSEPGVPGKSNKSDISQTLEQLRTLGELKDSGYITDKEFEKLKQEILNNRT